MSHPPADQQQRLQAVAPTASVHVEAPAGSGKTSVLLERFLVLLGQVDQPEALVALTFTRKAAGELRARLHKLLLAPASQAPELSDYDRRLLEIGQTAARRHLDLGWAALQERLQILTFHSFCARLLRQMPYAVGLAPDFQLLDEEETRRLQAEAVEETRQRLGQLPPADPRRQALVRRLVRLNNNWPLLAAELRRLLARRDVLGPFLELARRSQDPTGYEKLLRHQLQQLIQPRLQKARRLCLETDLGRQWPDFYQTLSSLNSSLAATLPPELPGAELEDLQAWCRIAVGLLKTDGGCYKSFGQPKFPKGFKDSPWCEVLAKLPAPLVAALRDLQKIPSCLLQPDEIPALQDLIILLSETLQTYDRRCRQAQALDFIALELAALRLLQDHEPSDLLLRLDYRLSHILVDEFQDTSLNQLNLLCRLLAGWTETDGRTLMVVGDPKQSIYEWRNARLELFVLSRQGLPCPDGPRKPLAPIILTTNFRASQTLINWVNEIFGRTVMAEPEAAGVEFHAATPAPGAAGGDPPRLALFFDRESEARWLAQQIYALLPSLPPAAKIGLLCFARTHLRLYLQALWELGLKPRVRDGLPLAESKAAQHLHNLVTALVRPHDAIAWAALLPGFGRQSSLAVVAAVAAQPDPLWPDKIGSYAASQEDREFRKWAEILLRARNRVGRQPLAEIVQDLLDRIAGWETIAAWEGAGGVANARAYLELLAAAAAASPEDTLARVSLAYERAYQPPDPQAQDSPVEILTVHGAKGLEYEHVFVPYLDYSPLRTGGEPEPFLLEENPVTGTALLALQRPAAKEEQSVLFTVLKDLAAKRRLAEARRLFYVAVTRAKQSLWLSGKLSGSRDKPDFPKSSPLAWLAEHYQGQVGRPGLLERWPDPLLEVVLEPEPPQVRMEAATPLQAPPQPWELRPDPWPYRLQFPSQLAETAADGPAGDSEAWARWRGEISHRLLETAAAGRPLPPEAAVSAALRQKGVPAAAAPQLAREILAEIEACLRDPWLHGLLKSQSGRVRTEWLLEGWQNEATVLRGQMDLVVFDGRDWWLVDYKTSRPGPGQTWEEFLTLEVERYRPQLTAYRDLLAGLLQLPPPELKMVLYFTARQERVQL